MENILKVNERIDDLQYEGLKIIQNKKGFCFGMDSVLLSDFAKEIKSLSSIIDLGTGTGIISILLSKKVKANKIVGIDIQKEVCDMATRSVKINHLENIIDILHMDIKNIRENFKENSFDVVVTNPPYKKKNTGLVNNNSIKLISRHEVTANLEDFIQASFYLLNNNGSLYMVQRPERLVDIIELLRRYHLEPKLLKFVYPKKEEEPNLILIKAIKNANPFLKIEKPLFIYNEKGSYTKEILKIYHKKIGGTHEAENYI